MAQNSSEKFRLKFVLEIDPEHTGSDTEEISTAEILVSSAGRPTSGYPGATGLSIGTLDGTPLDKDDQQFITEIVNCLNEHFIFPEEVEPLDDDSDLYGDCRNYPPV